MNTGKNNMLKHIKQRKTYGLTLLYRLYMYVTVELLFSEPS